MATQVKEQPRKKQEPLFWNPLASWIGSECRASIKASVKCLLNMTQQDQPRAEIDATHSAPRLHEYTKLWLAPCYIQASQTGWRTQLQGEPPSADDRMERLCKEVVGMERPRRDRGTRWWGQMAHKPSLGRQEAGRLTDYMSRGSKPSSHAPASRGLQLQITLSKIILLIMLRQPKHGPSGMRFYQLHSSIKLALITYIITY